MIRRTLLILLAASFISATAVSQDADPDLMRVKERLDSITTFSANLVLELEVNFINMPPKEAQMEYTRGEPMRFSGDDFLMIPRRGLDFSFSELFNYPFLTVPVENKGNGEKSMHVIPSDERSDLVMATLAIDTRKQRINSAMINTKKDGSYFLVFGYARDADILPSHVTVSFEIERIRIPFNFLGKDTEIDRKALREDGETEGKIYLTLSDYTIGR